MGEKKTLLIRSLAQIRTEPIEKPPPQIDGFTNVGELVLVTGQWDSFKSTFGSEIAKAVASGQPFLNKFTIMSQGPAMIWQQEIHPGFYDERIIKGTKGMNDDIPLYTLYDEFTFTAGYGAVIEQIIREYKLKLIVFDPLTMFYPTDRNFDENAAGSISAAIKPLLQLRNLNCTFVLIHHDPKPSQGFSGIARGSSVLTNAPDARIMLRREKDDDAVIVRARTRNLSTPSAFRAVFEDGRLTFSEKTRGRPSQDGNKKEVHTLWANGKTASDIIGSTKLPTSTIYRWIDEFEKS